MVKNTNIVKKANQALVLDAIRKNEKITTEEIISQTGLSRTTVLTMIKDLLEQKLIEKRGHVRQSVGRQPILYSLSRNVYYAIGVDVDVAPIYLNIARLDGKTVYSCQWNVSVNADGIELAESLVNHAHKALREARIRKDNIIGLGIGLPGVMDLKKNLAEKISRVRGWKNYDIAGELEREFDFPVYVRNDTHLLGHMEIEADNENMLYILHRSGIGMAPIVDGEVYEGTFGNSGYIGHTRIESQGRICNCGSKDCLELYCSKRSIECSYRELSGEEKSYDELIIAASNGDEDARSVFRTAGHYFGIGITNAVKTYDILKVVIGDLRCSEAHIFFQSIKDSVAEHSANFSVAQPTVHLSTHTKEQYGLGSCQFVLENFFEQPKLHTNVSENGGEWIESM
jgi:predicted NBD/HSP70 family sugar kinase